VRRLVLWVSLVPCAYGCGGRMDLEAAGEWGADSGADSANDVNSALTGDGPSHVLPPPPSLNFGRIVGTTSRDLWATGTTGTTLNLIFHWDGRTWTQVAVPSSLVSGGLEGQIAPARPDAIWIANPQGIVRLDATGKIDDFTADITPPPQDKLAVDSSLDAAVIVSQAENTAFHFDGLHFVALPTLPQVLQPSVPLVRVTSATDLGSRRRGVSFISMGRRGRWFKGSCPRMIPSRRCPVSSGPPMASPGSIARGSGMEARRRLHGPSIGTS
jgi:hypothetical protein